MKVKLPIPIKIYRVMSSQKHPDTGEPLCRYRVELYSDGKLYCDCVAGRMNKRCRHKIIAYEFIQKYEPDKKLKPIKYGEETKE